jgi:DNA-directed RNA polymerase subunit K/omega
MIFILVNLQSKLTKIKIELILSKNYLYIILMPKKASKKNSKKEDSDNEYMMEDDIEEMDDIDELDEEELEDEDSDDEKDDLVVDLENEPHGECAVEDAINEDDIYFDNNEETEVPVESSSEFVSKENRVSSNRLTKYEMVRILGERTKQLNMGAKPLIKNHTGLSYDNIAVEEFKLSMIPFKIKRPLPNGKFEIWTLDELYKEHLLAQLEE